MPSDKPGRGEIDETPGLAGGPGPTPPGVEDGTPELRRAAPEPSDPAPSQEEQRRHGEAAERSAGTRRADVPGLAGVREGRGEGREDPDEEDPERHARR
jgi:hypothetical protein